MTKFISNGDFIFPFDAVYYWLKHAYLWSYQSGATNLDGIIRLPWRLLNIVVFELFGNLAVSYFYLGISLLAVFFSFYYFCRTFLHLKNNATIIIGSLLFTFNPIFLGNLSKIGLVAATAMLPLCLALLSQAFARRRLSYLILCVFALNFSLLHPFTFTVNTVVAGMYFIYLSVKHWEFVKANLLKFTAILLTAFLLNLYFILPIISLGTVDKSALSQELTDRPVDYTWLVDVANTSDIFTALSLSKNVLKDYEFYQPSYAPIYFTATIGFYALLIGLYLYVEKRMGARDKQRFILFTGGFIILTLLATTTFLYIGDLLKLLINLPGGWMFRSPLKWQLFIPFVLYGALLVLMRNVKKKQLRWTINGALVAVLILSNAVLFSEIGQKLLVPRSTTHFAELQQQDLEQKTLMFVADDGCADFSRQNPAVMTELNQVLISENVQVKRVNSSQLNSIDLHGYDYVLGCELGPDIIQGQLAKFGPTATFADNIFQLFENTQPPSGIFAVDTVYNLGEQPNVPQARDMATAALGKSAFNFVSGQASGVKTTEFRNALAGLTVKNIQGDRIISTIPLAHSTAQELMIRDKGQPLYYSADSQRITVSPEQFTGSTPVQFTDGFGRLPLSGSALTLEYIDDQLSYQNILPNPSFEGGLWQKEVGDCNNYDDNPKIAMELGKQASQGSRSLLLSATWHTACTGPGQIQVEPDATYIFAFQHKTADPASGGYFVGFDSEDKRDVRKRLASGGHDWHTTTEVLQTPADTHELSMYIYAYPDELAGKTAQVAYDNFHLIQVPDILDSFYVTDISNGPSSPPKDLNYQVINPTKKTIAVSGASKPFYLVMRDNYHDKWKLALTGAGDATPQHFSLNNGMNGWYVDPALLCKADPDGCRQNANGTYDLQFTADFTPQRWFIIGSIISGLSAVGCIIYLVYDRHKYSQEKEAGHAKGI